MSQSVAVRTIEAHPVKGTGKWRVIVPASNTAPRHTKWFKTKERAVAFAQGVNNERAGRIEELYRLDRTSQALLVHALQKAGSARAVLDAVNAAGDPVRPTTVREAISALIADREDTGRSKEYVTALKWTLNKFALGRNDTAVSLITSRDVRDWLKEMGGTPDMRRAYTTRIRGLFKFAVEQKWTRENPAKTISMPDRSNAEPEVFAVDEVKEILRAALQQPEMATYFTLLFFAGLRPSEARRLKPEHIKADLIRIPVEVARKKKEVRNIPLNDALRSWLDAGRIGRRENFERRLVPANWKKLFQAIVKASGVEWKQDAARHLFVTASNEIYGWQETVKQAGHSLAMMVEHYRALTTREQAEKFWSLRPETVLPAVAKLPEFTG